MTDELEMLGIDPATLGVPAAAIVAAGLGLKWVAGPSIQAVGNAFGEWTQMRMRNLLGLAGRIESRIDPDDDRDGFVPPRLLYKVLEDGSWIEDDVAQEYLAGILIGSRSSDGKDEDGVYMAHVVSTLTSSQIRMHHAVYERLSALSPGREYGLAEDDEANALWAPLDEVNQVIGHDRDERRAAVASSVLDQAGLLSTRALGSPELFRSSGYFDGVPSRSAFVVVATALGGELFRLATSGGVAYRPPAGSTLNEAWVQSWERVPAGL